MTPSTKKTIEREKLVAEKLNGRLAMLGIIAGKNCRTYYTTINICSGKFCSSFCIVFKTLQN